MLIAIISYPIFLQPFFGAGGNGPMDILSHLNSVPFRQFAEMVLDIYNPLALDPLYQSLGLFCLLSRSGLVDQ